MAVTVPLPVKGPYDLALSLKVAASFSPDRAKDASTFRSAVRVDGAPAVLTVRQVRKRPPLLEVSGSRSRWIGRLAEAAGRMLFADLDLRPFYRLAAKHPKISGVARPLYGLKPTRPDSLFEMAVIAVTEQQISMTAAYRIRRRLTERFGECIDGLWAFPRAESLARASQRDLSACGLSRGKSTYIRDLARRVADGSLDLDALLRLPDDEARAFLVSLRGFGPWSADYILVRGLGRPDSVPADDLGVRTVVGRDLGSGGRMTPLEVRRALEPLAPFRGIATFYLLAHSRLPGGLPATAPGAGAAGR